MSATPVKTQPKTTAAEEKPVDMLGVRPNELAETLDISPKSLRAWLRSNFERPLDVKSSAWYLTKSQVKAATAHYTKPKEKAESKS